MKKTHTLSHVAGLLFLPFVYATEQSMDPSSDIESLEKLEVIEESQQENPQDTLVKLLPEQAQGIIDTADVLKKMAGANVNRNGRLTGIAQYRGLAGPRVNIHINGSAIYESGPNAMDSAMSHTPASMVDAVVLKRGIAPISSAIESIGGHIDVITKSAKTTNQEPIINTDVSLGFSSADSGKNAAIFVSGATSNHQLYFGADYSNGDSFEFPSGENFNTEYDKKYYQAGYTFHKDQQKLSFNTSYNDTGETGTPALPMDIVFIRGATIDGQYEYETNNGGLITAKIGYQNSDHEMNNFIFRNVNNRLYSINALVARSFGLTAQTDQSFGQLTFGIEGDDTTNQSDIFNADRANFRIDNLDTERSRNSVFVELNKDFNSSLSLSTGLRYTQVKTNAGTVASTVAMMDNPMGNLHRILRDRFNSSDRSITDNNIDFAINLQHKINDQWLINYGLGHKNRAPSYVERYTWLPLEVTGGLADGFQYFGNLSLAPEKASQLELGLQFTGNKLTFSPHFFYHHIDDYIQGTPTESQPAPPNTLTFNNVAAKIYGVDYELSYRINEQWVIDNISSYTRGERRDIDDNLYRIAPFNSTLGLTFSHDKWQIRAEVIGYSKQNKVSQTNQEKPTSGYVISNISGSYDFSSRTTLTIGVNNVFDKEYFDHLGGYNRNNNNQDVGFDMNNIRNNRLPGIGVNVFATLHMHW